MAQMSILETGQHDVLYEAVAERLAHQIENGTYRVGDRVPSIRRLSREWRVSISSVLGAYRMLENRGLIEARPQSGYYVRPRLAPIKTEPKRETQRCEPTRVDLPTMVVRLMKDAMTDGLTQFSAALPNPDLLPTESLNRVLAACLRQHGRLANAYDSVSGNKTYRVQIAQRYSRYGPALEPDEIISTSGCMEAMTMALRATCKPGDTVAIESPAYYGVLQAIDTLGLRALEIPTDAQQGIDIDALEFALDQYRVSAVIVVANFNNPLGSQLPDAGKKWLVELVTRHRIPLIEDDIYGDLAHAAERPVLAKAFDRDDWVILCSSFSKTLSPGLRTGWIASGRFREPIERIKMVSTISTAILPQLGIARFLEHENYDRHLRRIRRTYAERVAAMSAAVIQSFPEGTRVSQPAGSFVLWVQMPEQVDSIALYDKAVEHRITIAPGPIFSASGRFLNYMRLNCAYWSERSEHAIHTLGRLVHEQAQGEHHAARGARARAIAG